MMPRLRSVPLIVRSRSRYSSKGNTKTNCERLRKYNTQIIWREMRKYVQDLTKIISEDFKLYEDTRTASEEKGLGPEEIHRLA